jgi:hypothetical protein
VSGWQLASLVLLGALHGVNPAMGWLFAVLRGLQETSRRAVLIALVAIGIGHESSVGITMAIVEGSRHVVSEEVVKIAAAALLVAVALWKLVSARSHPRWVGLRIGLPELALWSFLMSTAHGAGLMLLPIAVNIADAHEALSAGLAWASVAAVLHTLAMIVTAGIVALFVYDVVGVGILRRAWFNLDRIWAIALLGAAGFTLLAP